MRRIEHAPPVLFALALLGIVFLLRIFYAGYVWADEGLWFTAAQELLRGRKLYSGIWFDKPPAVAWTYAALFGVAGPSLLAVRIFTILYATAVALALWQIGRHFWGEREGRLAALLYAIYNATYIHSQVQPMAVDQLMLLPYLYSGYFFLRGLTFWSGLLAAAAFSINPKAAALLLFFAVLAARPKVFGLQPETWRWTRLAAGFAAGSAPWAAYLLAGDKWDFYAREFWGWGLSYVSVYGPTVLLGNGLRRTLNYAGFHFPLVLGTVAAVWLALKATKPAQPLTTGPRPPAPAPWSLILWLGVSFLGVAAGGRFFPRYFYQVLPLLCLLAARGYEQGTGGRRQVTGGRRAFQFLPSAFRLLFWLGVAFALVRFHHRAVLHAYELATGRQTAYMAEWRDLAMDRDSRLIAQRVRGPLFVWGYRPEIYFYCGCPAASSYLSSQPLTGVPADIHLRESRSVAPERAAENRRRLRKDLESSPPPYIVDGLGPYNPALAMERYPELRQFLKKHYRRAGEIGHGIIYELSH